MTYKKCPRCETNYILENEDYCDICRAELELVTNKTIFHRKKIETDFSRIIRGCVYGTNSRNIYEKFCDTLGWDRNKINQFGFQTPLYATNADTNRKADVWFICYPNYDLQNLDGVVEDCHVLNLIQKNGDIILDAVDEKTGCSNNANRITFVKTENGYEFFGVYKIIQNGTTRVYQRISDIYPMN